MGLEIYLVAFGVGFVICAITSRAGTEPMRACPRCTKQIPLSHRTCRSCRYQIP